MVRIKFAVSRISAAALDGHLVGHGPLSFTRDVKEYAFFNDVDVAKQPLLRVSIGSIATACMSASAIGMQD